MSRAAVELEELAAFEEWFYSDPRHAEWSCLSAPYALASKAWQARADLRAPQAREDTPQGKDTK